MSTRLLQHFEISLSPLDRNVTSFAGVQHFYIQFHDPETNRTETGWMPCALFQRLPNKPGTKRYPYKVILRDSTGVVSRSCEVQAFDDEDAYRIAREMIPDFFPDAETILVKKI